MIRPDSGHTSGGPPVAAIYADTSLHPHSPNRNEFSASTDHCVGRYMPVGFLGSFCVCGDGVSLDGATADSCVGAATAVAADAEPSEAAAAAAAACWAW